jgi:hypothetical protein
MDAQRERRNGRKVRNLDQQILRIQREVIMKTFFYSGGFVRGFGYFASASAGEKGYAYERGHADEG